MEFCGFNGTTFIAVDRKTVLGLGKSVSNFRSVSIFHGTFPFMFFIASCTVQYKKIEHTVKYGFHSEVVGVLDTPSRALVRAAKTGSPFPRKDGRSGEAYHAFLHAQDGDEFKFI